MERGVLQGLAALRWAAWAWMALVLVLSRDELRHLLFGTLLVGLALAVTATATLRWRARRHDVLLGPAPASYSSPSPPGVDGAGGSCGLGVMGP